MISQEDRLLFFVPFATIKQWDVKRLMKRKTQFKNEVFLKDLLTPIKLTFDKKDIRAKGYRVVKKINFSGELFLRDLDESESVKGNLFSVPNNTLVYSKINVKHGCIYYHKIGLPTFGVTSEYPVFMVNQDKVIGDFLILLLQTDYFKEILKANDTGISKARTKVNDFLEIGIPLPTLEVQREILHSYITKVQEACKVQEESLSMQNMTTSLLHNLLEIKDYNTKNETLGHITFIQYARLKEWGVGFNKEVKQKISANYPTYKLKSLCKIGSGGTPSRTNKEYYVGDIPWIKTGEVLNNIIFDTEEKITVEAVANSSAKLYPKGSLIMAMYGQGETRGRTAKLGIDATTNQACAVMYDIDNSIILTDYLWYYLQFRYDDIRSMASGNNQPNLNAEKIKNYDIVVPPISKQEQLVDHIKSLKDKQEQLKALSLELMSAANKEFEKRIFE